MSYSDAFQRLKAQIVIHDPIHCTTAIYLVENLHKHRHLEQKAQGMVYSERQTIIFNFSY